MKEFFVMIRCRDAAELEKATGEAVAEIAKNADIINIMVMGEHLELTATTAEEMLLLRHL